MIDFTEEEKEFILNILKTTTVSLPATQLFKIGSLCESVLNKLTPEK